MCLAFTICEKQTAGHSSPAECRSWNVSTYLRKQIATRHHYNRLIDTVGGGTAPPFFSLQPPILLLPAAVDTAAPFTVVCVRFFSFLLYVSFPCSAEYLPRGTDFAHLKPQALQRVFGPFGPFRHSGLSSVPQSVHTYSSAIFCFFFLSELCRLSLSIGIGTPTSPRINAGDVSPVLRPFDRSPSPKRSPVSISRCSTLVAPS